MALIFGTAAHALRLHMAGCSLDTLLPLSLALVQRFAQEQQLVMQMLQPSSHVQQPHSSSHNSATHTAQPQQPQHRWQQPNDQAVNSAVDESPATWQHVPSSISSDTGTIATSAYVDDLLADVAKMTEWEEVCYVATHIVYACTR